MPCRLHLRLELLGCDDDPEMRLLGCASGHGFVVRVQVGVVMDFEGGGLKCCGDLGGVSWGLCWIIGEEGNGISTFERIASSMGVWEAIVKSGRLAKATRDLRSIKNACLSLVVLSPDPGLPVQYDQVGCIDIRQEEWRLSLWCIVPAAADPDNLRFGCSDLLTDSRALLSSAISCKESPCRSRRFTQASQIRFRRRASPHPALIFNILAK